MNWGKRPTASTEEYFPIFLPKADHKQATSSSSSPRASNRQPPRSFVVDGLSCGPPASTDMEMATRGQTGLQVLRYGWMDRLSHAYAWAHILRVGRLREAFWSSGLVVSLGYPPTFGRTPVQAYEMGLYISTSLC